MALGVGELWLAFGVFERCLSSLWKMPEVCAWLFGFAPVRTHSLAFPFSILAFVPIRTYSLSFTYIRKPYR